MTLTILTRIIVTAGAPYEDQWSLLVYLNTIQSVICPQKAANGRRHMELTKGFWLHHFSQTTQVWNVYHSSKTCLEFGINALTSSFPVDVYIEMLGNDKQNILKSPPPLYLGLGKFFCFFLVFLVFAVNSDAVFDGWLLRVGHVTCV